MAAEDRTLLKRRSRVSLNGWGGTEFFSKLATTTGFILRRNHKGVVVYSGVGTET